MTDMMAQRNARVLIVDDNRAIHEDFHKILARADESSGLMLETEAALFDEEPAPERPVSKGFQLDSGFQGEAGLALVQKALGEGAPYAMAFMDVRMPPGWDGIETTVKIWESDPDIQIVICTAYSDYSWEEMLRKLGQSDRFVILKKPFDNIEVLQLANSLTQKWQLLQEAKRKMADLERMAAARAAQLVQEQEKFRMIFENSPEGIFQTSVEGRLLSANPALAEIYGFASPDELVKELTGAKGHLFVDEGRWNEFRRLMRADGFVRDFEAQINCREGFKKWISQTACRVLGPDNSELYYQGFVIDITARKRANEERDLMEAHLQQAQTLESVGRLAAGIAHEINNPLQCVGGNVGFLAESFGDLTGSISDCQKMGAAMAANAVTPELLARAESMCDNADVAYLLKEIPTALRQAGEGVERVARIVRAMSDFSLCGNAEKTPTDLNRAIETTLTVSRSEWKETADVTTDFAADLPMVPCLRGEFNQTMLSLIMNAAHATGEAGRKAMGGKGRITITTRLEDGWVVIRVVDTGVGIRDEIRERVFEPFFTTKGVGKGTGLGLALARASIVNKHAGTIRFESEVGRGTTFIISLPVSTGAAAEPARAA